MPLQKVDYDPFAQATDPQATTTSARLQRVDYDPFQPAPERSSITRRLLGDTSVDLARGIVGAGEAAVGLADIPTFGGAGKALEAIGFRPAEAKEGLAQLYSPERKLANQEVSQAEGFLDTAGAMMRNPSTIAGAVTESVPATLGGGAIARGVGLARHLPAIARGAIGEGAVQAGMAAEQSRQGSESGFLDARDVTAAVGSGIGTGLIGAAGGNVARRLGIGDVDTALAGGATTTTPAPGFLRRTLAGAASEGVLEEMPQSIQEQAFANFADERPIGEGLGEAAAAGLLTGAAMGGGFAAVARPQQARSTQPATPDQAPPPAPVAPDPAGGPLSRAAHAAVVSGASAEAMAAHAAAAAPAGDAAASSGEGSTGQAEAFRLPPPPWIDPESGEVVGEPDLASAKAYVHEQLNRLEAAGEKPLNRGAWKRELGIADNLLANTVLGEVRAERAKGLRAPEERRQDVIERLRAGEPVTERDRLSLGAAETVGPRNAVRLFSEVLGTEQSAVNDLVAAIPAGSDGRRATLAVLQAAQSALRARTEVPDGSTVDAAPEGGAVEGGRDLFASAPDQADAGGADGRDAGAVAPAAGVASSPAPQLPAAGETAAPAVSDRIEVAAVRLNGQTYPVESLADARDKFRQVVDVTDVGASQTPDVELVDAHGAAVGHLSYNGRAWAGPPGSIDAEILDDGTVLRGDALARRSKERLRGSGAAPAETTQEANARITKALDDSIAAAGMPPVEAAAHQAATSPKNDLPQPTEAQKQAGNYPKGHARVAGLDVSIENPAGSRRRPEWPALKDHYGYIRGTVGKDKDHVDVFLTKDAEDTSRPVFVVDQVNRAGSFDEHKVVMGAANEAAARKAYLRNYSKGWTGLGAITEMTQDEFKAWVRDPKKTTRPAGKITQPAPKKAPSSTAAAAPIEDLGEKIGGARKDTSRPLGARGARPRSTSGEPWRKRYIAMQSLSDGKWYIHKTKKGSFGNPKAYPEGFATQAEAEAAIPLAEVARNHRVVPRGDEYAIARSVTDRKRVVLKSGFASREAAMRYMAENAVQLIETKTSLGEEALPLPERVVRQGPKRRDGDVTGQDFMDTFGFRGVEFGNWNNQAERQEVMNHAYDGLLDLAEVVGVPPRALSLNGDLALAFGARGHGLSAARAHYELDYAVMNLTKMQGAGALAHEWMHAVDHYFGRQDGKASSARVKNRRGDTVLASRGAERDFLSHGHLQKSGVRPELLEAYTELVRSMLRRGEKYVEDTARAEKFLGHARDQVSRQLTQIRDHIATERRYGSRKRAATPEELATFDTLSERILNGDAINTEWRAGTGRSLRGRWSNDTLDALDGVLKAVTNRGGFKAEAKGELDRLAAAMNQYAKRIKVWKDAESGESKTRQVPTEFLTEARKLDQGRGSDYWSSNHEMLARAFSAYVEDQLEAKGQSSDFLSFGSSGSFALPVGEEWGRPFPRGEERTAINAAFDKFFGEIRTKEGEDGRVALFSKAGRAGSDRASWDGFPAAVIADPFGPTQRPLRKNPNYAAAKAGDPRAAIALVTDYLTPDVVARFRAQIGDRKPVLVPVLAEEASGRNKIPLAFAEALSQALRLKVDHGIVQSVRAHHTASGAFHRIAFQSAFDGQVQSGQEYFLLDDAITMGGTLANLRGHIEANGGVVLGAGVLTGHPNGANIALQPATAQRLRETFGNDLDTYLQEEFGFDSTRLTEGEAGHILKARTLDAVRDRIAQARDAAGRADDGPPLRSASARDEVSAPPRAGRSASGLPIERARALLTELTKAWGDNRPAIRLVRSAAELPADVQADPDADRIEGLYNGSPVVWLNIGRIRTEQRFAEVLAHEVIGHYGVERVVGAKEWGAIVDSIERLDRSGRGSQQLREIFAAVRSRQPAAAADRVLFAKEAIAFMAERGVRNSWVNRVVAAVRRFLRRMMPSLQWSEAEVRRLLSQADSFLQRADSPAQRRALVRQYAFSQQASPFFSALANAVDVAQGAPKKGDAKAWKGWLDGAQRRGEFRQAERDWLGVDAFLERNGTTTREQLAEFVRGNQLQVEDVVLGAPENAEAGDPETLFAAMTQAIIEVEGDVSFEQTSAIDEWISGDIEDADLSRQTGVDMETIVRIKTANDPRATVYEKYTLPGGENYRELLLTLPPSDLPLDPSREDGGRVGEFRSGHFEQPNILAHVRFNERTDADGQRVLFLEEIQSDWHQAGRKQGYARQHLKTDYALISEGGPIAALGNRRQFVFRGPTGEVSMLGQTADEALSRILEETSPAKSSGVPDAPFKATDEWAMLAFKRMVRWAADHGFDRIAWTTGEQQADRYDLAKTVSQVSYSDGNRLIVRDKGGAVIYNDTTPENRIADVIGKEAAERLLAQPSRDWSSQAGSIGARARVISGDGLKMGGDGMRAFYDKILPSAVNKWARKLDGRVGETRIAYGEKFDYFKAPAGHYAVTHGNAVVAAVATQQEAVEAIKNLKAAAGTAVHALDITPTMREAVTAGLPLFSKAPADVLADITAVMDANQREGVVERARAVLRDLVPAKAKDQFRSTWLGALTTRHLTELGQDYFKNIRLYSDFLSEMGADRNQLQQEGEAIAERARKWAGKHRAQARQLFDLMHDSTIDGVDPAEEYKPLQFRYSGQLHDVTPKNVKEALAAIREQIRGRSGDNKKDMLAEAKTLRGMPAREKRRREKYPGLVERWNQLSPEAQQIYREFRDAYRSRSDAIEAALVQRIRDTDVPEGHKRKIIAVIRQQFETQRLQGVYFPLQRFGRYFVAAEREGTPTFLMFDRLSDLEGAVRDLKRRGFSITAQGLKNAGKAHDAPSGTFVAQVIQSLSNAGVSEQTQDEIYQLYLQTLPELSMRKHAIHRQAVPGFDPDAVRAFAFNMNHGAHQLARLRYGHKLQDVLTLLKQQQDAARKEAGADTRKIAAGDAILGELEKRHEWIQNPQDSQATSLVSSFGFTYYLGLTPAAALVNLTQTPLVSFPYLASRYGAVKAMNHLLSGMRDSIRTGGEMQKVLTDPDEQRAHAYLLKSGALDKSLAHNLAGIAEGGLAGYNPGWARAMEIVGWGFHKAEVVNREATGLAAFRMAKEAGASFDAAVRVAVDAINDTHFDYTNQNRARFMQSGTAKVLLMFRQYSLNMTWHLGRMVWNATKGESAEVKKIARRNLAGVLGMTALFSGTMGLPLLSVTMGVLNAIAASFGDPDEPWDAETEFRAFLADMLGDSVASLVLSGAANAATGADIASRVSLNQLWFRDADRQLDGRGAYYHLLEQAAGPMGGVLKNALVGKQLIDEGHLWRGVETTLPKALKDMLRGARYAREGVNTLRGDPLIPDASVRDTLLQVAGFTPAKVAQRYDTNRSLKNYEGFILDRRSRLIDAFAMANRLNDAEAKRETLVRIRAFNRANPEVAITPDTIRRSLGQRARYSARAESGITLDRRLARRVREAVGD